MSLLEIRADLTRTAAALERIALLLERLVIPELPRDIKIRPAGLDDLYQATPERNERVLAEQAEFAERYGVVPGSDAMWEAVRAWEVEQRSLYGDEWKAPEDWRAIFAGIHREGEAGGKRAAAPAAGAAR